MRLPFSKQKQAQDETPQTQLLIKDNPLYIYPNLNEAQKDFDWGYYNAAMNQQGGYSDEFQFHFTARVIKGLYAKEPWINFCVNAITRQFYRSSMQIKKMTSDEGDEQTITRHPLLRFLHSAGKENRGFFYANTVADLVLTGNSYWWVDPRTFDKKRLPSERTEPVIRDNEVIHYKLSGNGGGKSTIMQPEEVVHIMLPNPLCAHIGLSLLVALNLPTLIDKYGREYVVGFFLRGGNTSGIVQTDAKNADQLMRLARSIMQAFAGRKNMHSDKILPHGAEWKGSAAKFSEIQLTEVIKENQTLFRSATGVTNTVLGIAESVNRATAFAELEHFYRMTISPLQYIITAGIEQSSLWTTYGLNEEDELEFDNSHVDFLDPFERLLDQDSKLTGTWTVNERRERLGKDPMEGYDKLASEIKPANTGGGGSLFPLFSINPNREEQPALPVEEDASTRRVNFFLSAQKQHAETLKPSASLSDTYQREFGQWESIMLDNLKDPQKGIDKIKKRAAAFAEKMEKETTESVMKVYDRRIEQVLGSKSARGRTKDTAENEQDRRRKLEALRERAGEVVAGNILTNGETAFVGYSEANMQRAHKAIETLLDDGMSFADVEVEMREWFDEFYKGQAQTIVRTEFAAATGIVNQQFAQDLGTVTEKTRKIWISANDSATRAEHAALHLAEVEGKADEVPDMYFQLDGGDYLRYPLDPEGTAADVINCRCEVIYEVVEWSE